MGRKVQSIEIIETEKRIIFTVKNPEERIELDIPDLGYSTAVKFVSLFSNQLGLYRMDIDDDRINVSLDSAQKPDPYVSGLNINYVYSNVESGLGVFGMQLGIQNTPNAMKLYGGNDHNEFLAIARFVSTF